MKNVQNNRTALFYAGSMTYAMKGQKILKSNGIGSVIERTKGASDGGCSFSLRVAESDHSAASALLRRAGIGQYR